MVTKSTGGLTMKRGLFAALLGVLLLAALLFAPSTYADPAPASPQPRTLSVTGQGRIEVQPDTAVITFGVTQLRPSPMEAYTAMSEDLAKISGTVTSMGIKKEQIKTTAFNLQAEYNWTQEKGQVLTGYRATTSLQVETRELDQVAALIQAAMQSGANQLNGINFTVKDTDKLAQQALDLAVDDAKAKADRVASRLGAKVVRVKSVSIQDSGMPIYRPMMDGAGSMAAEAKVAPAPVFSGTNTFQVSVTVTFEIQ
jgi:uncharacterized protein YggE